ncbi:hypothetical protein [uncultured Hymenobacter sp.]|uniref:hypothetical protein n=1 Tax=uncultured Hymenobacter sp. TaxID=170016 RepID=UPI0035CB6F93
MPIVRFRFSWADLATTDPRHYLLDRRVIVRLILKDVGRKQARNQTYCGHSGYSILCGQLYEPYASYLSYSM